jgi:phosphoribosylanthranilate isomerase
MIVKICGLTSAENARIAIAAGADLLGFVFTETSKRRLGREACSWIRGLADDSQVAGGGRWEDGWQGSDGRGERVVPSRVPDAGPQTPVRRVGVFRNQDPAWIAEIAAQAGLDFIQLHGSETLEICERLGGRARVIKAIEVSGKAIDWARVAEYEQVARVLFDTASGTGGGTGRVFDWSVLRDRTVARDCVLAGGLRPDNVGEAIRLLRPAGVDVASGVEAVLGRKDAELVRRFIAVAREADE